MLGRVIDVSAILGIIRSEVQRSRWRWAQTWPIKDATQRVFSSAWLCDIHISDLYSASVRRIAINPSVCLCIRVSVCLSVCREHIFGTAGPIRAKFCVQIPCGRGSVLLRRRCATLCISGFMDDVTFGRNGRDATRWRLHREATAMNGVVIPGRSLMSMNGCLAVQQPAWNTGRYSLNVHLRTFILIVSNVGLWPANFPCPALDLQLMGNHLCG